MWIPSVAALCSGFQWGWDKGRGRDRGRVPWAPLPESSWAGCASPPKASCHVVLSPKPFQLQVVITAPPTVLELINSTPWYYPLLPSAPWVAQLIKNLLAKKDTPVQLLGREDPLEKA